MPCADNFEVNPLFEAANLSGEKVRVPRRDLDIVIACLTSGLKETTEMEAELNIGPHRTRPTVNRAALFALLTRHSRHHRALLEGTQRIIRADPVPTLSPTGRDMTRPENQPQPQKLPRSTGAADELADAFKGYLSTDPEARFKEVCKANGIDPAKYAGRNFGLQRMGLGNDLRNRLKKGTPVTIGSKVLK